MRGSRNNGKRLWTVRVLTVLAACLLSPLTSAAQGDRRLYDELFLEAMCQHQKGNDDAAFDLLNHCTELDSTRSEAYFFLSQYFERLKKKEKALLMVRRAADLEPENPTYLETLANGYINNREYASAAQTIEQLYEFSHSRSELLALLVQLYERTDDYDKAIGALSRLEAIEGVSERTSIAKSQLYNKKGDQKSAIREIKLLTDQFPNDQNYRTLYATTLYSNGQKKKALKLLNGILKAEPDNINALLAMMSHCSATGDSAQAAAIAEGIVVNPNIGIEDRLQMLRQIVNESEAAGGDSVRVLSLFHKILAQPQKNGDMAILCAAYMRMKEMPADSVTAMLYKAIELSPDNVNARLQLVGYAWDKGDRNEVIKLCQDARSYTPTEMTFYYYQGIALYQQGDNDAALDAFQNGISVIGDHSDPEMVSDFYSMMGDIMHQKGMVSEAFAAYDSCLVWKSDNIGCLNNYAYYLSLRGEQLDKAERMSYTTIKAQPKNATYLDTYAWILFMQERYAEAKIYIDQTLKYDNDSSSVLLEHAGDIYYHTGDVEAAVAKWQQAADKINSDDADAEERRQLLARKIKQRKYLKL